MGDRAEGGSSNEAGELRFALGGESLGKDFGVTVGPYAVGDSSLGPGSPPPQLWETEKEELPQPL